MVGRKSAEKGVQRDAPGKREEESLGYGGGPGSSLAAIGRWCDARGRAALLAYSIGAFFVRWC